MKLELTSSNPKFTKHNNYIIQVFQQLSLSLAQSTNTHLFLPKIFLFWPTFRPIVIQMDFIYDMRETFLRFTTLLRKKLSLLAEMEMRCRTYEKSGWRKDHFSLRLIEPKDIFFAVRRLAFQTY